MVDALASGASALRGVEVQVLSSAPISSYPNPPQSKTSGMWSQMMNNAHPPGWALFVLWSSWAHRQRWAVWLRGGVSRALRRVPEPVSARWTGRGVRVGASASAPPPPAGIVSPFFSCAVLPIVCARLLAAVGRAIALVRQDDSAVLID